MGGLLRTAGQKEIGGLGREVESATLWISDGDGEGRPAIVSWGTVNGDRGLSIWVEKRANLLVYGLEGSLHQRSVSNNSKAEKGGRPTFFSESQISPKPLDGRKGPDSSSVAPMTTNYS